MSYGHFVSQPSGRSAGTPEPTPTPARHKHSDSSRRSYLHPPNDDTLATNVHHSHRPPRIPENRRASRGAPRRRGRRTNPSANPSPSPPAPAQARHPPPFLHALPPHLHR